MVQDCTFLDIKNNGSKSIFMDYFGHVEVENIAKTGSGHTSLFISLGKSQQNALKPFGFLQF